jgi:hypothetical protein
MSIPVTCSDCQSHFHVGDEFAGRPGRCPECGHVLEVPDPAADHAVHAESADPHHPYGTPHFDHLPPPVPVGRDRGGDDRDEDRRARDGELRRRPRPDVREPRFDPHERAARWARVHRGLGYLQVAVVLGIVSQFLQTTLTLARGGVQQNPNGLPDSGQVALVFGAMALILAAGMFWLLGRGAGLRAPYVPARNCARPSFLMALGSVAMCVATCCLFVMAIGAAAQAGANGGPPPPGAVLMMVLALGAVFVTGGLAVGAEIAGLVGLGRIGDALRDRAAAAWARRSIVVMLVAAGIMMFGVCGIAVYAAQLEQERQKAMGGPGGANGAAANDKVKDKEKPKEKGKDGKKDAVPAQPPAAAGAGQNPPPEPIDGTVALVFDLVFFGPLILYLIHYSVALQTGRRAIRREIDVLTGRDHGEHDRHY